MLSILEHIYLEKPDLPSSSHTHMCYSSLNPKSLSFLWGNALDSISKDVFSCTPSSQILTVQFFMPIWCPVEMEDSLIQ